MQARKKPRTREENRSSTPRNGETRKYELVEGKKGAILENCAEKRKKRARKATKRFTRQAAKAARRRSSNQAIPRASKKAKDCAAIRHGFAANNLNWLAIATMNKFISIKKNRNIFFYVEDRNTSQCKIKKYFVKCYFIFLSN